MSIPAIWEADDWITLTGDSPYQREGVGGV